MGTLHTAGLNLQFSFHGSPPVDLTRLPQSSRGSREAWGLELEYLLAARFLLALLQHLPKAYLLARGLPRHESRSFTIVPHMLHRPAAALISSAAATSTLSWVVGTTVCTTAGRDSPPAVVLELGSSQDKSVDFLHKNTNHLQ